MSATDHAAKDLQGAANRRWIVFIAGALFAAPLLYWVEEKFAIRLAFDAHDLNVYFNSAGWIVDGGRLYRDVPSEYPVVANIIFAMLRYLANLIHPGAHAFYIVWAAVAGLVYICAARRIVKDSTMLAAVAWLAPAPIYFALLRFDIYPAFATLMFLFSARRADYFHGAVWLGVAIALKGYALFLLPAYCVFILHQRGFVAAIKVAALAGAPTVLGLLVILSLFGWEGMAAPFMFHAVRTFNGQSTYDAINYLFGNPESPLLEWLELRWPKVQWSEVQLAAPSLQIGCALFAAAMRPRSFGDLVDALLFAALGFISFSVFYSPQFVLWILPLACFSTSRRMLLSAIGFSYLTYLYFPISYDLTLYPSALRAMVIVVSVLRLFMMCLVVKGRYWPHHHPA